MIPENLLSPAQKRIVLTMHTFKILLCYFLLFAAIFVVGITLESWGVIGDSDDNGDPIERLR